MVSEEETFENVDGRTEDRQNHIRGCHGNHAFSRSPYQISFEENFVSHSEGPTEQFGMNLKGPRSAG